MTINEEWKKITGFNNYSVSSLGRIRNDRTDKILSISKDAKGYCVVYLHNDGKRFVRFVHRLVAIEFIDNPNNFDTVDHIKPDKNNNTVNNLMWLSMKDNSRKFQTEQISEEQKKARAEHCKRMYEKAKESNSKRVICLETGTIYKSTMDASRQLGICQTGISRCCKGEYKTTGGYRFVYID